MHATVEYMDWNGNIKRASVEIRTTGNKFYACNLSLFGCGKDANTPEDAARTLLASHGTEVRSIQIID